MTSLGAATTGSDRLSFLDGVRALAAMIVVMHHAWLTVYLHAPRGLFAYLTGWMAYGQFAVTVFIVVSGYSLTLAVVRGRKRSFATFIARRFRRIVLPYWAATAFSLVFASVFLAGPTPTIWHLSQNVTAASAVVHFLLLQDIHFPYQINYPMWTVAIEWHIYFVFPVVIMLMRRWPAATIALIVLGSGLVGALLPLEGTISSHGLYLLVYAPLFGAFALGVGACLLQDRVTREHGRWFAWLAVASTCASVLGCIAVGKQATLGHLQDFSIPIGIAVASAFVAIVSGAAEPLRALLSVRPLVQLGLFSYSLYLLHAPIIELVWRAMSRAGFHYDDGFSLIVLLCAGLAASLAAAYLFFLGIERRCMPGSIKRAERRELDLAKDGTWSDGSMPPLAHGAESAGGEALLPGTPAQPQPDA